MKKLAIGCAIVLVLGSAAVVGVVYYGYLKVKSTVTQLAELSKIPEIERDVRVKAAFSVPVSGELTSAEVDKFMQVTTRVRDRLGKNFDTIERTYKSLADKKGNTTVADLPALMSAYRDIAAAWLDAKRTQVAALNDVGLSLDEYRWIRSSSYAALGIPFVDVDFAKIAEKARSGNAQEGVLVGGAFTGTRPASNLKLFEKFRKQPEDYMPLAAFGL